jgi:hypothetical protein
MYCSLPLLFPSTDTKQKDMFLHIQQVSNDVVGQRGGQSGFYFE